MQKQHGGIRHAFAYLTIISYIANQIRIAVWLTTCTFETTSLLAPTSSHQHAAEVH